jgi:hypothetical protein
MTFINYAATENETGAEPGNPPIEVTHEALSGVRTVMRSGARRLRR